ncbi:DUF4870 domain-containing protein [Geitlerinema sp. PCC 9228]|uniref:DUF4870 domain-containing protein n=1 Tax=Geitlerinema sp. PCC 9228 TaxID=111611 RepID=UPI0008F9971E|nr:DUF4870 domain-containing protein [Geitlerinema sp. PCC 9228]
MKNQHHHIPDKDERTWASLSHLGFIATLVVPYGNLIVPLIIWIVYKDRSSYIDYHAKEALNFQITLSIGLTIGFILVFVVIGIFLLLILGLLGLIFAIIAAVQANKGEYYKYPFNLRLIE